MQDRDRRIDFLRFFGALVVMSAHAEPPPWLFQLRNFGTPLLIVVAALSAVAVFRNRPMDSWAFLRRRTLKLTVAPWIFLTVFFGLVSVYAYAVRKPFPFSANEILTSYALGSGIGYVWVFKVYLIIALLTPGLLRFRAEVGSKPAYFLILAAVYAFYEVFNRLLIAGVHDTRVLDVIDDSLVVVLPYAVLFAYGLRLGELSDRQIGIVALLALLVFAAMAAAKFQQTGHFVQTQLFKYPPTLYYLSYALFCVNTVYLVSKLPLLARLPAAPIAWLSSNLLWIYLWHIMGIFVWDRVVGPAQGRIGLFVLKLCFIVGFGVAITWLQKRVIGMLPTRPTPPARPRWPSVQTLFG